MTDEQLLNSLQGTMTTIDPYSVKKEAIDEYRKDLKLIYDELKELFETGIR